MSNEDLPSINDIVEENNLPSYKDFIDEKELPSVEDYITESPKEEVLVEDTQSHKYGGPVTQPRNLVGISGIFDSISVNFSSRCSFFTSKSSILLLFWSNCVKYSSIWVNLLLKLLNSSS